MTAPRSKFNLLTFSLTPPVYFQIENSSLQDKRPFFATIFPKQQLTAIDLFHAHQNSMTVVQKIQRLNCFYLEHLIIPYSLLWITYSRRNISITISILSIENIYTCLTQNLLKIGKLDNKEKRTRVTICLRVRIARTQLEPWGVYSCLRLLHVGFCEITS